MTASVNTLAGQVASLKARMAASGVDVARANIDGTGNLPMPATLVVGRDGVIRWADVHPDYSMRSEPADIIAAVTGILPRPGGAEPGTAEPGTAEPGTAEPGMAEPGTAEPGTAGPGPDEERK